MPGRAAILQARAGPRLGRLHPARHPHRTDDPLRLLPLPLPRRPAPSARPLPPVDPQDERQDRHRILTDDQLTDYQPWSDNQRRLRELIAELETLSQAIPDNDPRWNR